MTILSRKINPIYIIIAVIIYYIRYISRGVCIYVWYCIFLIELIQLKFISYDRFKRKPCEQREKVLKCTVYIPIVKNGMKKEHGIDCRTFGNSI